MGHSVVDHKVIYDLGIKTSNHIKSPLKAIPDKEDAVKRRTARKWKLEMEKEREEEKLRKIKKDKKQKKGRKKTFLEHEKHDQDIAAHKYNFEQDIEIESMDA